jgi:hypothetical protein
MNTLALLLVAAATTGDGLGKPHVGGLKLFRHNAVVEGPAPPGGPMVMPPGGGGPGGPGGPQAGRRFPNVRSQITFLDPKDMKISWQTAAGPGAEKVYTPGLVVPDRFNFLQGYIYRLRISEFGRGGAVLYPTIEVAPSTPATDAYLTHNAIPVQFTSEDFDQVVDGGNFVTKVIYLPDPKYQELAISGVPETLVSTRLEPGVDPIIEADKRGTILLIVRLGSINLEMNNGPVGAAITVPTVESVPVDGIEPNVVVPPAGATIIPAPAPGVEPAPSPLVPAPAAEGVTPVVPKPVLPTPVAPVPSAPVPPPAPVVVPTPAPTAPAPAAPAPAAPEIASLPAAPSLEPALAVPPVDAPLPVPSAPNN